MTFEEASRPFEFPGSSDVGVLVIHGFTSTPSSVIDWAQGINKAAGWTCVGPLLPGHGTVWSDLNTIRWEEWMSALEVTYKALTKRCQKVAVVGLSLGGALTLKLAARHPEIAGAVIVNNHMFVNNPLFPLTGVLRYLVPGTPAIAGDIKKPGVIEHSYRITATGGVDETRKLTNSLKKELANIKVPVLLMKSREDHLLPIKSSTWTQAHLGSARKDLIWLEDSYHVATIDNDLPRIVEESVKFIRSL